MEFDLSDDVGWLGDECIVSFMIFRRGRIVSLFILNKDQVF